MLTKNIDLELSPIAI